MTNFFILYFSTDIIFNFAYFFQVHIQGKEIWERLKFKNQNIVFIWCIVRTETLNFYLMFKYFTFIVFCFNVSIPSQKLKISVLKSLNFWENAKNLVYTLLISFAFIEDVNTADNNNETRKMEDDVIILPFLLERTIAKIIFHYSSYNG